LPMSQKLLPMSQKRHRRIDLDQCGDDGSDE